MKPNISPIPTSGVRGAIPSRSYRCSIGRTLRQRAGGLGIATASNAGEQLVRIMGRQTETSVMLGFVGGVSEIQRRQRRTTSADASNRNMASPSSESKKCGQRKMGSAPSANAPPRACLWITATRKGTSAVYCARRAIRFLVGTSGKRIRSFAFNTTSKGTLENSQPCHADVLLELANK